MSALPHQRMTVEEFLRWAEGQDRGRYELVRGEVVAMAPERAGHTRAKQAAARALRQAVERAGAPCEAFVEGLAIIIDESTSFEPDALVNCGPPIDDIATAAPYPVIAVEVLSPSTRHIDKAVKLIDYFRVPSLHHYVIVDLERRALVHHRRAEAGLIHTTLLRDGLLRLDPPGLEVAANDLFG